MEAILAAVAVALFVVLLSLWKKARIYTKKGRRKRYPPVAGTVLNQLLNFRRLSDYLTELSRKHRCFRMLHPGRSFVGITDPRDVEYVLSTNFANYGKGWYNQDNLAVLLGEGIFVVDGDKWRHQRKLASHEFSTRNLREYSSLAFRRDAARLAEIVLEAANLNQRIDLRDVLTKTTMDSIFKVGFGVELDTLRGTSEEGASFSKAFDIASEIVCGRYSDVLWRIKRALNVGSEARLRKCVRLIDDYTYRIIDQKIESVKAKAETGEEMNKEDILSRFLKEREREPDMISRRYLKDIILNFLIAGKDTTAGVLSWFFYMMCKNEGIQRRVAEEIDRAMGASSSASSIAEFVDKLGQVEPIPFLHAALNETLRLYPGVPLDPKMCFSDDTLPSGFDVREGDIVVYLSYCMGRLKELWGEDAEIYRPERWLEEDGSLRHESPFKFTAFQAGPRVCLGKEFAYRQMKIIAATLLHFFTFEMAEEGKEVGYRTMLTLQIEELHVRAFQRKPIY